MRRGSGRVFRIRPAHDKLLIGRPELRLGLLHLYKATPQQLCHLHYSPSSIKHVYGLLHDLAAAGYVQVHSYATEFTRPSGKEGIAARDYYMLTAAGVRYLAGKGIDIPADWRPQGNADIHGLFARHTIELNDVIIAAAQLKSADPRFYLAEFRHERELNKHPYPVTLPDGRQTSVAPDAMLDFRRTDIAGHFAVLLEHDRGSEEHAYFKRKVRAYVAFIKAKGYVSAFDTERINVAFTTFKGEAHMHQLRQWTRDVLDAQNEPRQVGVVFRFAALPQPLFPGTAWLEPRWHYAFDDSQPPQPLIAA